MHYLDYHYFKLDVICFKILPEIQYVVVLNSIEISAIKYLNIPYFIPLNISLLLITGTELQFLMIHGSNYCQNTTHNNTIHFVLKTFKPFRRVNKVCYSQQCLNFYCLITWWNASYMNSLIKIEMNDKPLFAWNPHISPLTSLRHHH